MTLGPVMLNIEGCELDDEDRRRLSHPQTGGIVLFSRNYQSKAQLTELCREIHDLRDPQLVITVDHEGGRVQRFRDEFQALPAMGQLGDLYDEDVDEAIRLAELFAWIMAIELRQHGVDLSFAPVLDIGDPKSSVIGDRAFHRDPEAVCRLANAWVRGMLEAGMEAVGKHFPGHGSVAGDSHHIMPFDPREFSDIEALDLVPFRRVISTHLAGIMMAHVIYDRVDENSAGYSRHWIQTVLRGQLGFEGIVFSDDLNMTGAEAVGDFATRGRKALEAGCDILLVCNNAEGADEVLDSLQGYSNPASQLRLVRLQGQVVNSDLDNEHRWQQACDELAQFHRRQGLSDSGDLFE